MISTFRQTKQKKMKLHEIIKSYTWLSLELTLQELYPERANLMDGYRNTFESLRILTPENNDTRILLEECVADDGTGRKTYIDVKGQQDNTGEVDEEGQPLEYALEWMEWGKWLGMDLAPATLKDFSELEIIVYCLCEMTCNGFDNEEIKQERRSLDKAMKAGKGRAGNDNKQATTSWDDLKKRLGE